MQSERRGCEMSEAPTTDDALWGLFERPAMYAGGASYLSVVTFLNGMSWGMSLVGEDEVFGDHEGSSPSFYDWLCGRVGVVSHPALGWHHLPLFLISGLERDEHGRPILPPERDEEAIRVLGELLSQYRNERGIRVR